MKNDKYSILYAEDEKNIRNMYVDVLKNYFESVYEATNGQEALEIYKNHKPDILLLDINMPMMSGLEVAKQLRAMGEDCKIIILSALSDTNTLIQACELYLVKYLVKPIKTLQLDSVLNQVIAELESKNKGENVATSFLKFEPQNMAIFDGTNEIKLSKKEFRLVSLLYEKKGDLVSTFDLINSIWENDFKNDYDPNKLRVMVYRLNKKFSKDIIFSSYNEGYYLSKKVL